MSCNTSHSKQGNIAIASVQHDLDCPGWSTSLAVHAARKAVERPATIWIAESGFADAAISKRYGSRGSRRSRNAQADRDVQGRQIEEDPEDFGKLGRISRVKRAPTEKIQKSWC